MSEKNCSIETLSRLLAGEQLDEVVDEIKSTIGQEREEKGLHLRDLTRITVILRGHYLFCRRRQFDLYPAIKEAHVIQEIFKILDLEVQPYRCSDAIIKSSKLTFKNVENGFWTRWEVMLGDICIGEIKESGQFYDRSSEIYLNIPKL